jgi:hypothetical protein
MPGMWTKAQREAAAERARKAWRDPKRKAARVKNIRSGVRKAMKDPVKRANLVAAVKRGGVTRTTSIEERFWSNVDKNGPTQTHMKTRCWLWTGPKQSLSIREVEHRVYGYIHKEGGKRAGQMLVHRYAYQLQHGELEDDLQVQHKCDVALCVRGSHLKQGTQQENSDDAKNHGRFSKRSK